MAVDLTDMVNLLGVGVLLTALYLQTESFVGQQIRAVAFQSLLLGGLLGLLSFEQGSLALTVLAGLTVGVRALVVPYLLDRQSAALRIPSRELRAGRRVTNHALAAVLVALIGGVLYLEVIGPALGSQAGLFPFLLLLEGLLLLATRSHALVRVIAYLEEENAIVLLGALVAAGLSLLVETVVLLDLFGLILVALVLTHERGSVGVPEEGFVEELTG
jgi:hydrogenase-4 component E